MHFENKKTGKIGEDLAARYLQDKGYTIIKRNWGNKWGEIDIIAKVECTRRGLVHSENGILVFVEVKTKIGEDWGHPEEMVNKRKLFQVQRMASVYSAEGQKRLDVIAVVLNNDLTVKRISHYEGVY
jgi:putative endonuclease